MSELWQMGALELAGAIRAGDVSSREVVEAHLMRVDKVNGDLNAIVRLLADEALTAADAADRAVADGGELGPLHGVPCTVKENIDVAGTPTTQGVIALAEAVAAVDAPAVARMRAAGAIPFARTNLPDLGLRIHTHSSLHGLTRNPWNPHVTAGGSSGGEASALASGMSPIGLGNDIGGSLRNPAHCCGIASIKPSVGVVPMATVIPPEDLMLAQQQMLVEGPMARHVADVRAGLLTIAGMDVRDPRSVPAQLTDAEPGERLRVAVLAEPPGGTTDTGIAATVRRVADILSDAGHDVVEAVPPDYEHVLQLWAMSLIIDLRVQRPMLDAVVGDEGRAIIANFDLVGADTRCRRDPRLPGGTLPGDADVVGVLRRSPGPVVAHVGAPRVRAWPGHRRQRVGRDARHPPPGAPRQRPRPPGGRRAGWRGRRASGRHPGDGRSLHRPPLPHDRRARSRLRWAGSRRSIP